MYRRQVDVQYNSLPRQSFPTLVQSVGNGNNGSSNNNGSMSGDLDVVASPSQQTTPKQRTVAFGKGFSQSSSSYSTPTINHAAALEGGGARNRGQSTTAAAVGGAFSSSTNNVYHHLLVLGQPGQLKGFEKQRGYSVPNLGGASFSFNNIFVPTSVLFD